MSATLAYAILFPADLERSIGFYRDILGLPLRFELSASRPCSRPTAWRTCPRKWQAAILEAEQNRPQLRVVSDD
jgi:catechol 2,3-dioxygenase-like lactoylglutathione lyase family enzyme